MKLRNPKLKKVNLSKLNMSKLSLSKLKLNKLKLASLDPRKLNKKNMKVVIPATIVVLFGVVAIVLAGGNNPHPVALGAHTNTPSHESGKKSPNSPATPSSNNSTPGAKTTGYIKTKNGIVKVTATTVVTPSNPAPNTNKPAPGGVVGPNLISNASAETASAGTPAGWSIAGWGTNTPGYNYLSTGHTGNHSLQTTISGWTNGDAKWGFTPVSPASGSFQFSDYYQSTVPTEVDADFIVNGVDTFVNLGTVPASGGWSQFVTQFTAPAGATAVVVYHILPGNGSLTTDDYFLGTYTPAAFNRGIVSINFDDGWLNQYQNAVPVIESKGLPASFFIITDSSFTNPDPLYMNATQVNDLKNHGFEIGNHTKTHPDLTTLTAAQQQDEMVASQTVFQNAIGVTPTDFAYPFGAYNSATLSLGASVFQTQRTVVSGFNSRDTINFQQLKIEEVDSNISVAQVEGWINQALTQKTWLILVYHEVATTPADPTDGLYTTQPADFTTEMTYLKGSGVAVETTQQAYNEIRAQL